jgi:sulfate adenylyltransferase
MTTDQTIAPHGGTLIDLLVPDADRDKLVDEAGRSPSLIVRERELSDLEMLAVGALSPLTGFQGERDYHAILETMHLADGLAWAIPVTLSIDDDTSHRLGGAAWGGGGGGRRGGPPPPRRSCRRPRGCGRHRTSRRP